MTPRRLARLLALLVATQAVALVFPWAAWVMIVVGVLGFAWTARYWSGPTMVIDRAGLHLKRRGRTGRAWDVVDADGKP